MTVLSPGRLTRWNAKSILTIAIAFIGFIISVYLIFPYIQDKPVGFCLVGQTGEISGCDIVRTSEYSHLLGVPLPVFGALFYAFVMGYVLLRQMLPASIRRFEQELGVAPDGVAAWTGFFFSIYLTGIEAFVLHAWCFYCILQAIAAFLLFLIYLFTSPRFINWAYRTVLKPLLFRLDPEVVHNGFVSFGRQSVRLPLVPGLMRNTFVVEDRRLHVEKYDRTFHSPIGLSAGFDYNGLLTQALPLIGFGFESVGTVTYKAYEGNTAPRLGRLPKSGSLLVNKGFKNQGIRAILDNNIAFPATQTFGYQIGLSIGATNHPEINHAAAQIDDIINSFEIIKDDERFAYIELNISCPNVAGSGSLATPDALDTVLTKIRALNIKRPLWIKFPVELPWAESKSLLDILVRHQVDAVVMGNLVKDRSNPAFDASEIEQAGKGNFSGRPTWALSNQLIAQTYKTYGEKLTIVGVGGVFSADDAYEKIRLGATFVQLITGMVYNGPGFIHTVNAGLIRRLEADGYEHITDAVGAAHRESDES